MGCGWTTCQDASSPVYVKPAETREPRSDAAALYTNPDATLDDLREAVTTLAEIEGTARHVLGGAHPTAVGIEGYLRDARAALRAREAPSPGGA